MKKGVLGQLLRRKIAPTHIPNPNLNPGTPIFTTPIFTEHLR